MAAATRSAKSVHAPPMLKKTGAYQMSVIRVKVKPNSRESTVEELEDGSFFVKLRAQPTDGKANAELIAVLAKHFNVPKAAVIIKSGAGSRIKLVSISSS
jgi:hypothetical protein